MAGIAKSVESLIHPAVTGSGYELYDLVFVKEGSNWYLRVFIDKPGGVTIDDCEKVSSEEFTFIPPKGVDIIDNRVTKPIIQRNVIDEEDI